MAIHFYAVGTIFERPDGKILLLFRHNLEVEGNTWGLVGGSIRKGESPEDAALREIKEEIGLEIESSAIKFVDSYRLVFNGYDIKFELFKAKIDKLEEISLDVKENVKYRWFKPKDAYRRKDLLGGLYPILEKEYKLGR